MAKLNGVFGVYDSSGDFRPYAAYAGQASDFDGLETWRILPSRALALRPLRQGDLVFYHATRQLDALNGSELDIRSEAGEFLPGFYTTSGTNLDDSLKLGWYWYECPRKTNKPKHDWHVILFVLRKAHFETYLAGGFVRETNHYYLQEPRSFAGGGNAATAEDIKAIEFANRNGQVMVFPDNTTKVGCGRVAAPYSLDDFVLAGQAKDIMGAYSVIVGLQKPPPLDMRQQCWVYPDGIWHINHAERYSVFDRSKQQLDSINGFVAANS